MIIVLSETVALVPCLLRTCAPNVFKLCSSVRVLFVFDLAEWEEPAFKLLDSSFVDEACAGVTSICALKLFFEKNPANVWTSTHWPRNILSKIVSPCHSQLALGGSYRSTGVYRCSLIGKDPWPLSMHQLLYSLICILYLPTNDTFVLVDMWRWQRRLSE